ncbi:hypothetical protein KJ975_09795 [Myxococcota bacterium]|nr:hypothetical protein [Myxococcota bacterium]
MSNQKKSNRRTTSEHPAAVSGALRLLGTGGRIAVLNRQEAALRCIRAIRDMNSCEGTTFEDVAILPRSDRKSLVARIASRVVFLPGETSRAYEVTDALIRLLHDHRIDAVWPGWGFQSENWRLADSLEKAGIIFLGPGAGAMQRLGDKIESKRTAESAGIPVIPWRTIASEAELPLAAELGFPIVLKASGGGGGRGIRVVERGDQLAEAFGSVRAEAPGDVFAEKLIPSGRHVEVQVVADLHAHVRSFGTRDCSLQRRRQKVLEEAPCVALPIDLCDQLERYSRDLAASVGYRSAGTCEFLVDDAGHPYFMEMNTRIQVEHTVTEEAYDVDLVRAQIHVAQGKELPESPFSTENIESGKRRSPSHSVEVRVYAEDPSAGFVPAPGRIRALHFGQGPGIRVDCGVGVGEEISPHFDAMIAKIMARGRTREEAVTRLARALDETRILIDGGTTNIPFLRYLINAPEVREGRLHTTLIDQKLLSDYLAFPQELLTPAVCAAAICEHRKREKENVVNFIARPLITGSVENAQLIHLSGTGGLFAAHVMRVGHKEYLFKMPYGYATARWTDEGADEGLLEFDGCQHKIVTEPKSAEWRLYVDGHFTVIRLVDRGVVRAPAPAIVTAIHVQQGQDIAVGDRLFTLEAMKMELAVTATEGGVVEKLEVFPGSQVFAGGILARLRAHDEEGGTEMRIPVLEQFPSPDLALRLLEGVMLGYDVGEAEQELAQHRFAAAAWDEFSPLVPEVFRTVVHFAAASEILSPHPKFPSETAAAGVRSARTILTDVIRRPNLNLHQLPADLVRPIEQLLPLYGLFHLDEGPALHPVLFRFRRVLNRAHARRSACMSLLSFLFVFRAELRDPPDTLREALQVLSIDSEGNSRQTDLVETIRAMLYDQPERARRTRDIRELLARSAEEEDLDLDSVKKIIRHARWPELLALHRIPTEKSLHLLAWAFWGEMILREDLVTRSPLPASCLQLGFAKKSANPRFPERRRFFCMLPAASWRTDLQQLVPFVAPSSADSLELVLDRAEATSAEFCAFFSSLPLRLTEITVVDLTAGSTRLFRSPIGHAFIEDTQLCGLHPAQAARLELWRFSEFTLTRIECDDAILFSAKAKKNPDDERLVAMIEVFDPKARTDSAGRRRFPDVSMGFRSACQAIRQQQSRRAKNQRLHWNHLVMGIYPLPMLDGAETVAIAEDLLPYSTRLGLEQVVVNTIIEGTRIDTHGFYSVKIRGRANEGLSIDQGPQDSAVLLPLREEERMEIRARRRGLNSPESVLRILKRDAEGKLTGRFTPYDIAVDPLHGHMFGFQTETLASANCGVVFGILSIPTRAHPEGLERVVVLSNPLHNMGSLAEPECRRIQAAMDLAQERELGVLWIPISAGAHIDFESGTENLDWTARVLRRIVEFTEAGGRIDILVSGINVGAQSYFDAEATMTISTKGFLVMTQEGAMVLTGKRALDFSGSVSAEDNLGIGGFERIMGPTGQAQALVRDIGAGHVLLLQHADLVTPGSDGRVCVLPSADPIDRDVCAFPYPTHLGHDFVTVGGIFSEQQNPGRKKPFSVQPVMQAVRDADGVWVERWGTMGDGAEGVVISETRVGGTPVGFIGIEATGFPRMGQIPTDGPDTWTPSTLFPRGSYKIARALAAFSGQVPAVIFANLSGFDGSPESLRSWQLIHGAEIGRALVNFRGPVLLVVLSRYHGGAYVVFSTALNSRMEAVAITGSYASVIGGSAAAAVVFDSTISADVEKHPRVISLRKELESATGGA